MCCVVAHRRSHARILSVSLRYCTGRADTLVPDVFFLSLSFFRGRRRRRRRRRGSDHHQAPRFWAATNRRSTFWLYRIFASSSETALVDVVVVIIVVFDFFDDQPPQRIRISFVLSIGATQPLVIRGHHDPLLATAVVALRAVGGAIPVGKKVAAVMKMISQKDPTNYASGGGPQQQLSVHFIFWHNVLCPVANDERLPKSRVAW
jgi:hypothetical protein